MPKHRVNTDKAQVLIGLVHGGFHLCRIKPLNLWQKFKFYYGLEDYTESSEVYYYDWTGPTLINIQQLLDDLYPRWQIYLWTFQFSERTRSTKGSIVKKVFKFTVETDTSFPDDLYGEEDFRERLQDAVDQTNWVFPGTPICKITVEELWCGLNHPYITCIGATSPILMALSKLMSKDIHTRIAFGVAMIASEFIYSRRLTAFCCGDLTHSRQDITKYKIGS